MHIAKLPSMYPEQTSLLASNSTNRLSLKLSIALDKIDIKVPIVIRLAGTNVEKGNKILKESKINYIEANTLEDAANKAVKALGK